MPSHLVGITLLSTLLLLACRGSRLSADNTANGSMGMVSFHAECYCSSASQANPCIASGSPQSVSIHASGTGPGAYVNCVYYFDAYFDAELGNDPATAWESNPNMTAQNCYLNSFGNWSDDSGTGCEVEDFSVPSTHTITADAGFDGPAVTINADDTQTFSCTS
jgi:hypothetical protein